MVISSLAKKFHGFSKVLIPLSIINKLFFMNIESMLASINNDFEYLYYRVMTDSYKGIFKITSIW